MTTSVKMDDETKSRLERLQAEIRLETDKRVSQQEILARLVLRATESKAEFIDSFRDTHVPLDSNAREQFHSGMIASGTRTTEDDIDDILYG